MLLIAGMPSVAAEKREACLRQSAREASVIVFAADHAMSASISALQLWTVGRRCKYWPLGLGIRFNTVYSARHSSYTTASSYLRTDKAWPVALFSKRINQNIDTLHLSASRIHTINLYVAIQHQFSSRWNAEFNLDLAGFAFGPLQQTELTYGETSNAVRQTDARPTSLNLLRMGNDLGALNAQCLLGYRYNNRIRFRAGVSLQQTEYTIERPVLYTTSLGSVIDADRFHRRSLLFGVGLNYSFNIKT